MILDRYLSLEKKYFISVVIGFIWIMFRTDSCYNLIPRGKILPALVVSLWIYLNYKEPLFLPLGLFVLFVGSYIADHSKNTKTLNY